MTVRSLVVWCVLVVTLGISTAAQPYSEAQFKGMKWRDIGPFRGGRVLAVTGIPGSPFTYYFGGVAGGVWRTTDGGVSWAGTAAGVGSATLVRLVCVMTGVVPVRWVGISIAAAVVGMIADSFLGALLERRKLLNNDAVNFLGTLIAAAVAFLLA